MSSGDRGFRNNNPGNIRLGLPWQGMAPTQTDGSFVQFVAPQWGIRAMAKILLHYQSEGFTTVRQIINHWAPPSENDTDAYVADVSALCQTTPDSAIDVRAELPHLIPAIIRHENGSQPYSPDVISLGISLAETPTA
jgi:hypothetical protein